MEIAYTIRGGSPSGTWASIEFKNKVYEFHYSHWEGDTYVSSVFDENGDKYNTNWFLPTEATRWLDRQEKHFKDSLEEERKSY